MFESDLVRGRVEIDKVAAAHIDGADTKTHLARIETIEIDQTLQVATARFVRRECAPGARGFLRLLRRHRHHVGVEVGDDPDRTGDDEKDDQHAKGESQNIIRAVGPAAQMQKEDEMDADLR